MMLVATVDPNLTDACGPQPSWVCETTWNITHSRTVATAAEWFVTKPLTALIVLLVAGLLNRWCRKAVTALIDRTMNRQALAAQALEKVGISPPERMREINERNRQRSETLGAVLRASISVFVWTMAVLIVLGLFNISVAPLLASAGIAGVAIGFGAQSLVRDTISGFFILLEDQFGVGDVVDLGLATGTVESVTLRTTTLRGPDGAVWHVPNGGILRVGNRSRAWAQAAVDVTVAAGTDPDAASRVLLEAAERIASSEAHAASLIAAPVVVPVARVTTDGLVLRVSVRVKPGTQGALLDDLRAAARTELTAAGIDVTALSDVA